MKLLLIAAVLSCALLSLSNANGTETEQGLSLKEEPQNVEPQLVIEEEPLVLGSTDAQKVLMQIPEIVQAAADEQVNDAGIEEVDNNTEAIAIAIPQEAPPLHDREAKQLVGYIPTYVLRQAIRMAQEQELKDGQFFNYVNNEEDEIAEERAIRRRKRFRRRNSKGHLKKSRRHRNSNKRKLKKRRKVNTKRKTQNRRGSTIKRKQTGNVKRNKKRNQPNKRRRN